MVFTVVIALVMIDMQTVLLLLLKFSLIFHYIGTY